MSIPTYVRYRFARSRPRWSFSIITISSTNWQQNEELFSLIFRSFFQRKLKSSNVYVGKVPIKDMGTHYLTQHGMKKPIDLS